MVRRHEKEVGEVSESAIPSSSEVWLEILVDINDIIDGEGEYRWANITDEHAPYQDDEARAVALKIVEEFRPHGLLRGSDQLDFYNLSRFDKDAKRMMFGNLQRELDDAFGMDREWRDAAPDSVMYFVEGNHEQRLNKWLCRHPEMVGLDALKLSNLLQLPERGIEGVFKEINLGGYLVVKHGRYVRKEPGWSAKAEMEHEKFQISGVSGHTHRMGLHRATTRSGIIEWHEGGCLCQTDPDYIDRPNWQQGLVLVTIRKNAPPVFEPILIQKARGRAWAAWRGGAYQS